LGFTIFWLEKNSPEDACRLQPVEMGIASGQRVRLKRLGDNAMVRR
jgi:hypothetical protein